MGTALHAIDLPEYISPKHNFCTHEKMILLLSWYFRISGPFRTDRNGTKNGVRSELEHKLSGLVLLATPQPNAHFLDIATALKMWIIVFISCLAMFTGVHASQGLRFSSPANETARAIHAPMLGCALVAPPTASGMVKFRQIRIHLRPFNDLGECPERGP
jgi:hypothetical protein